MNKIINCIIQFYLQCIKFHLMKKYGSNNLEGAISYSISEQKDKDSLKLMEVEKRRVLAVPFQYCFSDQNEIIAKYGCYFYVFYSYL